MDQGEHEREHDELRGDVRALRNTVFRNRDTHEDGLVTRVAALEAGDTGDRWLLRIVAAVVLADAAGIPIGSLIGSIFGFGG